MPRQRRLSERDQNLTRLFQQAHITQRSKSKYGPPIEVICRNLVTDERTIHRLDFHPDYSITLELRFRRPVPVRDVAESFQEYASASIPGLLENLMHRRELGGGLSIYQLGNEDQRTYVEAKDKESQIARDINIISHYIDATSPLLCYVQNIFGVNVMMGDHAVGRTVMQGRKIGRTKLH